MACIISDNEEFGNAARFYADVLGIPENTIIGIKLYDNLDGVAGYCEYHTEEAIPYIIIGIEMNDDAHDPPLSVLAHEMVHAKQYALGELVEVGRSSVWKGTVVPDYLPNSKEYYFSPFEVEAYGMQVGLYRMYCRMSKV